MLIHFLVCWSWFVGLGLLVLVCWSWFVGLGCWSWFVSSFQQIRYLSGPHRVKPIQMGMFYFIRNLSIFTGVNIPKKLTKPVCFSDVMCVPVPKLLENLQIYRKIKDSMSHWIFFLKKNSSRETNFNMAKKKGK